MIKIKNTDFLAEIYDITDKTRLETSMFAGTLVHGQINKGDVVQFLDKDGKFIVEEKISSIEHSRQSFETMKKGDSEGNFVLLIFHEIWEYPINDTKYIVKMNEVAQSEYKRKPQVILPINNILPYQQLITKTLDIQEFVQKFYIYPLSTNLGYYFLDIYHEIGIECLRETKLGALYSVHKVSQGGLLYIFYARLDYASYVKVSGWYYVRNKLSSDNFSSIKKESTLYDVIAIDSSTQIYQNIYNSNDFLFNLKGVGLDTYHFLNDGIMKLHFVYTKPTNENGQLLVDKKKYVDFNDIKLIQPGEKIYSINGCILPMDMID